MYLISFGDKYAIAALFQFSAGKDHSENKIIVQSGLFENEIGPGVLMSSVQKTCVLQEHQRHKAEATEYVSILSFSSGILAGKYFIKR